MLTDVSEISGVEENLPLNSPPASSSPLDFAGAQMFGFYPEGSVPSCETRAKAAREVTELGQRRKCYQPFINTRVPRRSLFLCPLIQGPLGFHSCKRLPAVLNPSSTKTDFSSWDNLRYRNGYPLTCRLWQNRLIIITIIKFQVKYCGSSDTPMKS